MYYFYTLKKQFSGYQTIIIHLFFMAQQLAYLVYLRKENKIIKKTITTLAILLVLIGFEAEASQVI
jgi:uncharacterized membrane protein